MEMRQLGTTGLMINAIGFGGIPIQRVTQEDVNGIIEALVNETINFIDTARGYTTSEAMIGQAIQGKREHFVIATKSMARTYEAMREDIAKSLHDLGVECIDLYQCHNVKSMEEYQMVMGANGAYQALLEAQAEGQIKHLGITSHSLDLLSAVIDQTPFETIQFPYNIVERQGEDLFAKAKQRGIGVICMKPVAGGAIENGQLSLKFIVNNENVSVAIPGMEKLEEVKVNSQVSKDSLTLTAEEMTEIEAIKAELNENFCRRCGYCMPCSEGINIPTQFIFEGYYSRYNLKEWASERYHAQSVDASACMSCGECEPRCPYNLPIRQMLLKVANTFQG